jgi:hypothetical protein
MSAKRHRGRADTRDRADPLGRIEREPHPEHPAVGVPHDVRRVDVQVVKACDQHRRVPRAQIDSAEIHGVCLAVTRHVERNAASARHARHHRSPMHRRETNPMQYHDRLATADLKGTRGVALRLEPELGCVRLQAIALEDVVFDLMELCACGLPKRHRGHLPEVALMANHITDPAVGKVG